MGTLVTDFPDLLKEWNYTRNNGLFPCYVKPFSGKKVWWMCSINTNHEWFGSIAHRSNGTGCPYCAGKKLLYEDSITAKFPQLAIEWHPTRNDNTPDKLLPGSAKKVWWKCSKAGHEWECYIQNRISQKQGCPYCSGKRPSPEYNLLVKYPELSEEWHPIKNVLTPSNVTPHSNKKAWWICNKNSDHEWEAKIVDRTCKLSNCPYCSNQRVSSTNSLLIVNPEVAREWHPTKNGDLKPSDMTYGSRTMAWWLCDNGHEWKTYVYCRAAGGTNCPYCCNSYTKLEQLVENKLGIAKYNRSVIHNDRHKPDFKLTDDLYMNVDGLYWHSEINKEVDYHYKLRELFQNNNKRLLQFYEDEIRFKWSIVESIINNAIGKTSTKYSARKCVIKSVSNNIAQEFYNNNHLMGHNKFSTHFGLYFDNTLVSMISVKRNDSGIEISRFSTLINTSVVGGFQKLVKHIVKVYNPAKVVSYCDLRYATGNSYKKAGFRQVSTTIGFNWVNDNRQRFNRLYCKATECMTEAENAEQMKLYKIYDAGQAKYELICQPAQVQLL